MTHLNADPRATSAHPEGVQRATFAAGCFWGVEAAFRELDGVLDVTVGYTGGTMADPTYEQVCGGGTGHAEAVEVIFDPATVSYRQLLETFWQIHNPTTPNRQGWDLGSQYRSVIFFHDREQERLALATRDSEQESLVKPIVTEIVPATILLSRRGVPPALLRALRVCGVWGHDRGALEPLRMGPSVSSSARVGDTARAGHGAASARDAGGS